MRVAPLAGAWIEIAVSFCIAAPHSVAPLAGAWIEIEMHIVSVMENGSLPSRERGLKLVHINSLIPVPRCRSPRGSVD